MKITISFKNIEHTPALDEKIKSKTQHLKKYLGGNTVVHWTCSVHDGKHCADVKLSGPSFQYNASAQSENMYKTLDLAINKIEVQLHKQKEKWKNKIHRKDNIQNHLQDEKSQEEDGYEYE